jgi:mannose-6-phosphate isomerase-like protein (cupin superfamily)
VLKFLPLVLAFGLGVAATKELPVKPRFLVKQDAEVMHKEPGPHDGTGETTAYRYFDSLADAKLIFRKRALHPGASIGMHKLDHDEVYYVVSGRAELSVGDTRREMAAGTAAFMYENTSVGIRQLGNEDLVIIVAYPPPKP